MKFYRNIFLFFFIATSLIQVFVHKQQDFDNIPLAINYGKASDDASRSNPAKRSDDFNPVRLPKVSLVSQSVYHSHIRHSKRKSERFFSLAAATGHLYFKNSSRSICLLPYNSALNTDGLYSYLVHFLRC